MKEFIRNELKGWKKGEALWLLAACSVIWGLSIYWQDTAMGVISSVTGVACVVLTGKGKLSAYFFGLVNSVLYAIISFRAALYGETLLNALYYVPMQFVGFFLWNKNMNGETAEVMKRRMSTKAWLLTIAGIAAATFAFGLFLRRIGDAMPFVDSFTTVCSVAAMLISVLMYAEQWWIWVAVNIVSVYMWWRSFSVGNDNAATLMMWVVYLVNAVIMLTRWEKEARRNHEV